jgi:hypothetical protein
MSNETSGDELFSFAMKLREERLFPCLCFQLDSFKCLEMLKELLGTLEERQQTEFPNHYIDLEIEAGKTEKGRGANDREEGSSSKVKKNRDDDDDSRSVASENDFIATFVDTSAPHPRLVLNLRLIFLI